MLLGQPHPPGLSGNTRLNGWKDISAYLDKSVRTVQRWEKELDLPVRRIHSGSGEIVFAYAHELDAWMHGAVHPATNGDRETALGNGASSVREAGPAPQSPSGSTSAMKRWLAAAVLLLMLAWSTPTIWKDFVGQGKLAGQPARLTFQENRLTVFDLDDRVLWSVPLTSGVAPDFYANPVAGWNYGAVADLDGDGRNEVIVDRINDGDHEVLRVFDPAGNERFDYWMTRAVQFGTERFAPPWYSQGFVLVPEPDGNQSILVRVVHNLWYPSALLRLGADGKVQGEYWSNGHIALARVENLDGARRVLVGATNNDHFAATLAVLDYDHPSGSAPAEDKKYECRECPPGRPLQFVVFPRMEVSIKMQERPNTTGIRLDGEGNILVNVFQGAVPRLNEAYLHATGIYTVNSKGHVLAGETADSYRLGHSLLEGTGQINHSFGIECEKQLFPVLRWDGARFVPESGKLGSPPRQHATNLAERKSSPNLSPTTLH